jgi:hypothetical protein
MCVNQLSIETRGKYSRFFDLGEAFGRFIQENLKISGINNVGSDHGACKVQAHHHDLCMMGWILDRLLGSWLVSIGESVSLVGGNLFNDNNCHTSEGERTVEQIQPNHQLKRASNHVG